MPDHWQGRITFWISVVSILTSVGVVFAGVTGKLGLLVVGPPELIAEVKTEDSLRAAVLAEDVQKRLILSDGVHAHMDSVDRDQDRRLTNVESKLDIIVALGCANFPRRDIGVSRLDATCSSTLDRWRTPRGNP